MVLEHVTEKETELEKSLVVQDDETIVLEQNESSREKNVTNETPKNMSDHKVHSNIAVLYDT